MLTDTQIAAKRAELREELIRDQAIEALTECEDLDRKLFAAILVQLIAKDAPKPEAQQTLGALVEKIVADYVEGSVCEELAEWIAEAPEREAMDRDERRFEARREAL